MLEGFTKKIRYINSSQGASAANYKLATRIIHNASLPNEIDKFCLVRVLTGSSNFEKQSVIETK